MNFSLVDDPWIPVIGLNGDSCLLSLRDTFRRADELLALDAAPHERVSLTRLLVCVTQAALGAPEDYYGWPDFGADLKEAAVAYLEREDIFPHFNLFGEGPRFLQTRVPVKDEPVLASKLMPHLATGNNPTALDHEGGTPRVFPPARLALALLAFQNFYPLYGAGFKGKGPCVDGNMAHTLLVGKTLGETVLLNCLDRDAIENHYPPFGMGRPLWELKEGSPDFETIATTSWLGRLVPRHRNLWLREDGATFDLSNQSLQYPVFEACREPSATVRVIKKTGAEERRLLGLRLDRAIWRDLHVITVIDAQKKPQNAPLTLFSHTALQFNYVKEEQQRSVPLWVGGLVTDLKAKILDTVESVFDVPWALFKKEERRIYQEGVELAEEQGRHLFSAVKNYATALKHDRPATDEAARHYWNTLDQQSSLLLDMVGKGGASSMNEPDNPWRDRLYKAARAAYEAVCPRQTPRQCKAWVEGLKVLRVRNKNASGAKKKAKSRDASSAVV